MVTLCVVSLSANNQPHNVLVVSSPFLIKATIRPNTLFQKEESKRSKLPARINYGRQSPKRIRGSMKYIHELTVSI